MNVGTRDMATLGDKEIDMISTTSTEVKQGASRLELTHVKGKCRYEFL